MASAGDLQATGLIEKDVNNDVLWTWSYPSVSIHHRELLIRKCALDSISSNWISFLYGQYQRSWYYILSSEVTDSSKLPKVKYFSLIILARDFNPEKYEVLLRIMSRTYADTGNPAAMLEYYLAVITRGCCKAEENGMFTVADYDKKQVYATADVKYVINTFGLESILIYTALILKKRIVVYHHRLEDLYYFMRALPALVWHRQNWNILHPYVHLIDDELDELRSCPGFVAGFLDAAVEGRSDLFDLFVNLAATEIAVAPHAKEALTMTKTHKDIALFMTRCAEDEDLTDLEVIKEVAVKTTELLNNLKSLATVTESGQLVVSMESLRERKAPPAVENFLFNLAVAENMIQL